MKRICNPAVAVGVLILAFALIGSGRVTFGFFPAVEETGFTPHSNFQLAHQ